MTYDNTGTINVLGLSNKGSNYIYNGGQTGPLKIGTTDNTNLELSAKGATVLAIKSDGSAQFSNSVSANKVTAQTGIFDAIQVGPTVPGVIKTRFSGAYSMSLTGSYAYYGSAVWGTIASTFPSTFSMEVDNRILLRNELNITSDRRIKKDIAPIDVSGVMESLDAVSYTLNSEDNKFTHLGFIAQDVAAAVSSKSYLPAIVNVIKTDELDDMHILDKNALLAVLWQTVKDLSARVTKLDVAIQTANNKV